MPILKPESSWFSVQHKVPVTGECKQPCSHSVSHFAMPHLVHCLAHWKLSLKAHAFLFRKAGSISMRCWYSSHSLPGNDWISRMIKLLMSTDTARAFYEGLMVQIMSLIRKAEYITEDEIKKKVMGISRDRNRYMVGFLDVSQVLNIQKKS